jgi:hypothetical protein
MDIDDVISYYIGKVVRDKRNLIGSGPVSTSRSREKELERDLLILNALRCAKANGFTGE